jgi:hypothetical protein
MQIISIYVLQFGFSRLKDKLMSQTKANVYDGAATLGTDSNLLWHCSSVRIADFPFWPMLIFDLNAAKP